MTKLISICVLVFGFSVMAHAQAPASAPAQTAAPAAEVKEAVKEVAAACQADMEKFCSDVKKGGGRVRKCMREHKDQLSAGCKAEIEEKKASRKK